MKRITLLVVGMFAIAILSLVGCGGTAYSIAPVSGKVTCDGQPVADLRLIFTPIPNEANTDPGPWSTGVTDAQGAYSLKTRYDKNGAAVGNHNVSFEWNDAGGDLEMLEEDLDAAKDEGEKEEVDEIMKKIAALKDRRKNGPKISEALNYETTVPEGGSRLGEFRLGKVAARGAQQPLGARYQLGGATA